MGIKFTIISLATDADNLPTEQVFTKNEIVIGRGDGVDLNLNDHEVSKRHAIIKLEDDNCLYIEDLSSLNGTIIENRMIPANTMVLLNKKDRVMIGEYLIKPEIVSDDSIEENIATSNEVEEEIIEENTSEEAKEATVENVDENIFDENSVIEEEIPVVNDNIFELSNVQENEKNEVVEKAEEDITLMNNNDIENLPLEEEIDNDDDFLIISGTADESMSSNINLEAIRLLTLKGKCKRFGKGIAGVTITLNDKTVVSNEEGKFEFNNILEDEPLSITATKKGFVFDMKDVPNKISDDSEISINGAQTFTVKGNIIYKGKGLENVAIENGLKNNLVTSKDGSFVIENVIEGTRFSFVPKLENYLFEYKNEEVTIDNDLTINVKAIKLISINGYIKYKGAPINGVTIDAGALGKTVTDENGYYEFKNIKEGTPYTLKAYKEGFKFQKA